MLPIRSPLGDRSLKKINNGFILCARSMNWDIALVKTDSNGQVTAVNDEIIPLHNNTLYNYPNPFNPLTTIKFSISNSTKVLLQIFNVKGQLVKTLLNDEIQSGEHSVIWDADNQASGIYFVKLSDDVDVSRNHKIILIK